MWTCTPCPQSPILITPHTQATLCSVNNEYRASSPCCNRCNSTNSIPCNNRCSSQCNNQCNHRCSKTCSRRCSRPCRSRCNTLRIRITFRTSNERSVPLPANLAFLQHLLSVLHLLVTILTNFHLAPKTASGFFLYQYPIGNTPILEFTPSGSSLRQTLPQRQTPTTHIGSFLIPLEHSTFAWRTVIRTENQDTLFHLYRRHDGGLIGVFFLQLFSTCFSWQHVSIGTKLPRRLCSHTFLVNVNYFVLLSIMHA